MQPGGWVRSALTSAPFIAFSTHFLRSVIPCCCSCLLAGFGLSGHLGVSWLHGNPPHSQQTGLCFQLWGYSVWLDTVCSMCRCCLKSSYISAYNLSLHHYQGTSGWFLLLCLMLSLLIMPHAAGSRPRETFPLGELNEFKCAEACPSPFPHWKHR